MLVHEVGRQSEQILDELVRDAVIILQPGQVLELNKAVLIDIDLFHNEEGDVARHL